MALELRALGAPVELVARAEEARADEIRHAEAMARQAGRFGACVPALAPSPMHLRGREAIALENAVEGCVRETFGAIIAAYQARRAVDRALRAELGIIAVEEARHAQLSWDVGVWLEGGLEPDAQTRVRRARLAALVELGAALSRDADAQTAIAGLSDFTGLPSRAVVDELVASASAPIARAA
jgi:hypothetical protein